MPLSSDGPAGWLAPQWLVAGVALAGTALLLSYDVRLGLAAGALIGAFAAAWLYLALRYGSLSGAPSVRLALVKQAQRQAQLRRLAAARSARRPRPDPAKRD